jgi:hypothetical protein
MTDSERDSLLARLDVRTHKLDVFLARLEERLSSMERVTSNHLSHHWAVTLMAAGAVLTAIASMIIGLVR